MENNGFTPQPSPSNVPGQAFINGTISEPPKGSQKKSKKYVYICLFAIALLVAASIGVYFWQSQIVKSKEKEIVQLQQELNQAKEYNKNLPAIVSLPTDSQYTHSDCSKNLSNTVLAVLTPTPIEGHQAYLEVCLEDGESVPSLQGLTATSTAKVIVFETSADGQKTFKYGAGSGEPLCFSNKILPENVANGLSAATKLPICKTF